MAEPRRGIAPNLGHRVYLYALWCHNGYAVGGAALGVHHNGHCKGFYAFPLWRKPIADGAVERIHHKEHLASHRLAIVGGDDALFSAGERHPAHTRRARPQRVELRRERQQGHAPPHNHRQYRSAEFQSLNCDYYAPAAFAR